MPVEVYRSLDKVVRNPQGVMTVGSFDGVHLGHRKIISRLQSETGKSGGQTTVVTFEPHPQLVIKREDKPPIKILTTADEKVALLGRAGVDRVVIINFTRSFSEMPSEQFVRNTLFQTIGMKKIVIGYDHGFGKNREGDVATLTRLGEELGFTVVELDSLKADETPISSSRIRAALAGGHLEQANEWLADFYRLSGKVVGGDGRGKQIGFPTANLALLDPNKLIPQHGVYATIVRLGNQYYRGMMNIGLRPTFGGGSSTLEVHLFDFDRDIYDEIVEVQFVARLRDERKFSSVDELVEQLNHDRDLAVKKLRNIEPQSFDSFGGR